MPHGVAGLHRLEASGAFASGRAREDSVAPYHYLCDGQLSKCVPQPGTTTRLDAQGDKLMQRLTYRNFGQAVHCCGASVDTSAGAAGCGGISSRSTIRGC